MAKEINVKEVFRIGFILFAITALAAAMLAFVNAKTKPLIDENAIIKEQNAMNSVMESAASFDEVEITADIEETAGRFGGTVEKAYLAKDASGNTVGACVITETSGYDVGIETVTGVDADNKVTGVDIIAMNETPGLGANAQNDAFKNQYIDKTGTVEVSKTAADDTHIQAISGATKTSRGVTNGVNIALSVSEKLLNGGDK